ncbi:B-lymphocyte antigen CD19 isoform X2 [Ahaetulla prasina]|uniref:B-lymphocyte antigen CD19 isoform X2 n=1 Tax=Ahaetulla prasina TaxID=499056 RepID=UPI0026495E57|nr:B-lymphocyte antigen CD19 isoform X2 [Ahaetulla prasina]
MAPVLCYLLLLWVSYHWTATTETTKETVQVIQVTESQQVSLSCKLDHTLTSSDLKLIWLGPKKNELLYVNVGYHHPEARLNAMWGLSIYRIVQNTTWFTCNWNGQSGNHHVLPNRTSGDDSDGIQEKMKAYEKEDYEDHSGNFSDGNSSFPYVSPKESERHQPQEDLLRSAMDPENFSCDAPVFRNWTEGTLLWIQHDSADQNTVLINMTIRRSVRYSLNMNGSLVSLILPRVSLEDAGNYSCQWKNETRYFQLEVIAKTVVWHWMIWSTAMGYMIICFGSVFCFLRIRQVSRARRQQKKLMSHNRRRYFYAKRNKRCVFNRIMVSAGNDDQQVDAYENMPPDMGAQRGQRLLQKGKILPNTLKIEDEEEYECPDSETELKSDDDENYENTQEEVKPGDVVLNDVLIYENNQDKVKFDLHNGNSADSWYSNKTEVVLENLTQDQDPIAEDNENYINLEEECPMNSGAARLIAGLRLQLALDIHKDRQDGGSEPSIGSQSYEEMNGSLCPTASKLFYLHTNTSNEEDADSYENMESPTNLNSRRDGTLDKHGEDSPSGSRWQHISVPYGSDFRGGLLCSD